jgi:hypothetical protein
MEIVMENTTTTKSGDGLTFGGAPRRFEPRPRSERTPEQQETAQKRYMASPHFQARVALEKDRLLGRQQDRDRRQAAFDQTRESRAAERARANMPDTPQERAFAGRGYGDFGKDQAKVGTELLATVGTIQAAAPGLWENSEPGRTAKHAFAVVGLYEQGRANNGDLDKAMKDMIYANPPTAANRQTGEITPERQQAADLWAANVKQAQKMVDVVRAVDREHHPDKAPAGPGKDGPAR